MGTGGRDPDRRSGHGVVIAHPSPSIRMRLALILLEEHPVFLANGAGGMLHHVWLAQRGCIEAPRAIVLSAAQLEELSAMPPAWQACGCTRLVVIAREARVIEGADAVLAAPDTHRVLELLAA